MTAVAVQNGRRARLRRGRRGRGARNGVLSGGGRRQAVADPDRIHDPFSAQDGARGRRRRRRRERPTRGPRTGPRGPTRPAAGCASAGTRRRARPDPRAGNARAARRRRRRRHSPRGGIGRRRPAGRGGGGDRRRRAVRGPRQRARRDLRVVVSDTAHESCVRDFSAAELGGPAPVDWSCFARARAGGLNETRVRARAEHPEETKQTLTKAELTTVPGTIGDPLRVLQNMPGVARAPFGLGLLIVRGANPTDTGVFIGGEPIPVLYHFLAGPSVFTHNLIDKIDFYPGGFGVRYGRFIGGARRRQPQGQRRPHAPRRGRHQPARLVGLRRRGRCRGGMRTSFAVRRSYIDTLLPYFIPDAGRLDVRHRRAGLLGLPGARRQGPPGGGRVGLLAYGSSDNLEVIAQDPTIELESNSHIGFHHVMGEWVTTLGGWSSRLSATYGYGDQSVSTEHARRLPALPPPLRARGLQPALQPRARAVDGARLRAQLRLGALRQPAVSARRAHHRHDDAAADGRHRPLALQHGAGRLRRGAVEPRRPACASSPGCASTTTTSSRPTSSRSIPGSRFAGS